MSAIKIGITVDKELLAQLDQLVDQRLFPNRSRAIQDAIQDKLARLNRSRLARECAKLDIHEEQALAEVGLGEDLNLWPEY